MNIKILPPTESDSNCQIYILALVCHVNEHASQSPPKCNSVEQKHLRLLDYIALLLVTKCRCRGDSGAHRRLPYFNFEKNRPCDRSTLSFVNRILKLLKEQPLEFIQKSMLMIVMVNCVEKVSAKIRKSQKALEEVGEINIAQSSPSINQGKVLDSWEGLENLQIISKFLNELKTFVPSTQILRSKLKTYMWVYIKAFLIDAFILYPFFFLASQCL